MKPVPHTSPSTAFLLIVCVMSPLCGVTDAQPEQVDRNVTGGSSTTVAPQGETTPAHVFAHVALVRSELELIRSEMGKPISSPSELHITGAAPREVFFQALTLVRKADALCFEMTHLKSPTPEIPHGEIRPADVRRVVNAALRRLRRVKRKLSIPEKSHEPHPDDSMTPTDVFRSIVEANRQLNLMLDHQFSPAEAFQQVTTAVGYAARLLEGFPGATRIAAPPPFERGRCPGDVYGRLLECSQRLRAVTERSGLGMLTLTASPAATKHATPSDVYELATLIISELAYLHEHVAEIEPPEAAYYPGRKFPAHVFQRAGILARQLEELQRLVDENPNWLTISTIRGPGTVRDGGKTSYENP